MAQAQPPFGARGRTIPPAHGFWGRDRRPDPPRQLRAAAKPPTNDRTDRETGHSSSETHHRSPRYVPDKVSARGERTRVASVAFPCLVERTKAQRRTATLSTVLLKTLKRCDGQRFGNHRRGRLRQRLASRAGVARMCQ